ncbi:hypothetical protein PVAP13_6KG110870 [Panicum virgatum]|uniref:Uncharacterized protein n=1 Tax=Panicum virgatum TaxID=38727 RepID=A0A8T0RB46_PANVG|nr:hypothetical protein PVAP13_6KG110870 [Panicum virgatum]
MSSEIVDASMVRAERNVARGNNVHREDSCCNRFCQSPSPMVARYFYAILFLLANLSAWSVRENHMTFFEGQRLNGCLGDRDCLAAEVVLIISLTSFLFFSIMFFSTMHTRKVHDHRNSWHSQWWIVKGVLLMGCFMISKLAPSYWIELYGKVAHFGEGYLK